MLQFLIFYKKYEIFSFFKKIINGVFEKLFERKHRKAAGHTVIRSATSHSGALAQWVKIDNNQESESPHIRGRLQIDTLRPSTLCLVGL